MAARPLGAGTFVGWTGRADGDLRPPADAVAAAALEHLVGRPVAWARQVHGGDVAVVERAGPAGPADALVTSSTGVAVAVFTADCAPVALSGGDGSAPDQLVAAVHAGWRGLVAGVVEATVGVLRNRGATAIVAALGPCIHGECYAFGRRELELVVGRFGADVASTTADGRPALDLPAAVRISLERAGAVLRHEDATCTACAALSCFSHRARSDSGRQAMAVWRSRD
ncbi:MAG: polyphenol oxidase family protein [Acidimicrobiales bacterium]